MLTIEEKALNSAKELNGSFVVKTLSAPGGCCEAEIKDIIVELKTSFEGSSKNYQCYEYEGIKVFIDKYLIVDENIKVYRTLKFPIIGSTYKVTGVSVKYF